MNAALDAAIDSLQSTIANGEWKPAIIALAEFNNVAHQIAQAPQAAREKTLQEAAAKIEQLLGSLNALRDQTRVELQHLNRGRKAIQAYS